MQNYLENKMEKIIYKHKMNRAPAKEDIEDKVGIDGFMRELEKQGWVSTDNEFIIHKNFTYSNEQHSEPENNYIEWTGILFYT